MAAEEATFDRIAEAFAQVVDVKSLWTYKHSSGVADIAVGIAQSLGLSPDEQDSIRRMGLLHDIGKLVVSNTVLDKPARLDDREFACRSRSACWRLPTSSRH